MAEGQSWLQAGGQLGQGSGKLREGVSRAGALKASCPGVRGYMGQGVLMIWMQGTDAIKFISWRPGPRKGEDPNWQWPGKGTRDPEPTGPATPRGDMGQMCEKPSPHLGCPASFPYLSVAHVGQENGSMKCRWVSPPPPLPNKPGSGECPSPMSSPSNAFCQLWFPSPPPGIPCELLGPGPNKQNSPALSPCLLTWEPRAGQALRSGPIMVWGG